MKFETLENRVLFDVVFADADFSRTVDTNDFTIMSENFGQTKRADVAHGDFTQDQVTNALDFNVLASQFGETMANRTWAGTTSTDINAALTAGWLVAQPTSADIGVFNSATWVQAPDTDSGLVRTWGGIDISTGGLTEGAFSNINVSGVLALGTGQDADLGFHDVGTVTGTLGDGHTLSIINLNGTVSGSNIGVDGILNVAAGTGTIEANNSQPQYVVSNAFTGTIHANSNKTCDFSNSDILDASVKFTGTGTASVITGYTQGNNAGCEGFTVTGGLAGTKAQGATYAGTISANRIASGFNSSSYTIRFTGPDDTADIACTASAFSVTVPSTTGVGATTVQLLDDTHNIIINLDTINVTAVPTADASESDNPVIVGTGHAGGLYADWTPDRGTIGSVSMTGFDRPAPLHWTGVAGASTPTGSQAVILGDGTQTVNAGNVNVSAASVGNRANAANMLLLDLI